jgi:hypothetical protein
MMDYSGCPNDPWIKDLAEMTPNSQHDHFHLLMNVGFNKGYNFANWLNSQLGSYLIRTIVLENQY